MSNAPSTDPLAGLIPPPAEVNNEHKVYSTAVGCLAMCLVASCAVLWRLYVRLAARKLGLDDYAMTFALLCYLAWSGLAIYTNLHAGVGKPLWELTLGEIILWNQSIVGCAFLYPVVSTSIRVSLLLFYRRIFVHPGLSRVFDWVIAGMLTLQIVYVAVFCAVTVLPCHPMSAAWDPLHNAEYCDPWIYINETISLYSVSLAFDLALLALPIWPVARLRLPAKKRAGVLLLFLLGLSASFAAAWKLAVYTWELKRFTDIDPRWYNYAMSRVVPPQFDTYGVTFWIPSMLEPTLALICASLPVLRPTLVRIWDVVSAKSGLRFGRARCKKPSGATDIVTGADPSSYDWATTTIGGSSRKLFESGKASRSGLHASCSETSSRKTVCHDEHEVLQLGGTRNGPVV